LDSQNYDRSADLVRIGMMRIVLPATDGQEGRSVLSRNADTGIASHPAIDLPQDEATCGRVSTMRAICPAFPSIMRFS
jgi:hypothetical protein